MTASVQVSMVRTWCRGQTISCSLVSPSAHGTGLCIASSEHCSDVSPAHFWDRGQLLAGQTCLLPQRRRWINMENRLSVVSKGMPKKLVYPVLKPLRLSPWVRLLFHFRAFSKSNYSGYGLLKAFGELSLMGYNHVTCFFYLNS